MCILLFYQNDPFLVDSTKSNVFYWFLLLVKFIIAYTRLCVFYCLYPKYVHKLQLICNTLLLTLDLNFKKLAYFGKL